MSFSLYLKYMSFFTLSATVGKASIPPRNVMCPFVGFTSLVVTSKMLLRGKVTYSISSWRPSYCSFDDKLHTYFTPCFLPRFTSSLSNVSCLVILPQPRGLTMVGDTPRTNDYTMRTASRSAKSFEGSFSLRGRVPLRT